MHSNDINTEYRFCILHIMTITTEGQLRNVFDSDSHKLDWLFMEELNGFRGNSML